MIIADQPAAAVRVAVEGTATAINGRITPRSVKDILASAALNRLALRKT
jgi:hypothetical protein